LYRELLSKNDPTNTATYISELARREYRQHTAHHFPESRIMEFQEKKRNINRDNNKELFKARCEGRTGYPMVDAGMRQLVTEKRMHGRNRMVVASFLTKDLLIDRRRGEQFFAQHLLDYDANVNIGNRQRSASV
jgi:deoxyribodipyrimidine photo-lyase